MEKAQDDGGSGTRGIRDANAQFCTLDPIIAGCRESALFSTVIDPPSSACYRRKTAWILDGQTHTGCRRQPDDPKGLRYGPGRPGLHSAGRPIGGRGPGRCQGGTARPGHRRRGVGGGQWLRPVRVVEGRSGSARRSCAHPGVQPEPLGRGARSPGWCRRSSAQAIRQPDAARQRERGPAGSGTTGARPGSRGCPSSPDCPVAAFRARRRHGRGARARGRKLRRVHHRAQLRGEPGSLDRPAADLVRGSAGAYRCTAAPHG